MLKIIKKIFGTNQKQFKEDIKYSKKEIIFDEKTKKVLNKSQQGLKPLLEEFSCSHFLSGGTAISLYLGHRKSIDFDFFSDKPQGTFADFINRIGKYNFNVSLEDKENFKGIEFESQNEIHVNINGVRISCINFYKTLYDNQKICINGKDYILGGLRIASLEELLSMKLFAMISRNKWKDAVDLYFLLKTLNFSLEKALDLSENKYFINIFNKDAVLEQLISMNWDKTEKVYYLVDNPPSDSEIIEFLKNKAIKLILKSTCKIN